MSQAVISLFEHPSRFTEPWAAGYVCYCIDVQHPEGSWNLARRQIEFHTFVSAANSYTDVPF